MGIRNYLIEGSSGTGKTSVATELERRGYHVVHGDRVLAYVGDPETGRALAGPPEGADRIEWGYAHWIWPVDKVRAIAADTAHPVTFFCGGSRNFHKFLDLFDKVFVLDADVETLNRRLDGRPDEPGFEPGERALVLRYHGTREYLPAGISIDTAGTVPSVVDDILAQLTGSLENVANGRWRGNSDGRLRMAGRSRPHSGHTCIASRMTGSSPFESFPNPFSTRKRAFR